MELMMFGRGTGPLARLENSQKTRCGMTLSTVRDLGCSGKRVVSELQNKKHSKGKREPSETSNLKNTYLPLCSSPPLLLGKRVELREAEIPCSSTLSGNFLGDVRTEETKFVHSMVT